LLAVHFGRRFQSPPGQFHANLVFTNDDTIFRQACRITGSPDVELIGPPDPMFGAISFVPTARGTPATITLRPGQDAHAVLTWLPWEPGNANRWAPSYARIVVRTNHGQSIPVALPWRFGTVLRQDGATHSGTFVGPIAPKSA
jgi:Domain of unknown function (DUF4232)